MGRRTRFVPRSTWKVHSERWGRRRIPSDKKNQLVRLEFLAGSRGRPEEPRHPRPGLLTRKHLTARAIIIPSISSEKWTAKNAPAALAIRFHPHMVYVHVESDPHRLRPLLGPLSNRQAEDLAEALVLSLSLDGGDGYLGIQVRGLLPMDPGQRGDTKYGRVMTSLAAAAEPRTAAAPRYEYDVFFTIRSHRWR